jgi:predicted nucleic-acid-binding Zn-ribbon protein
MADTYDPRDDEWECPKCGAVTDSVSVCPKCGEFEPQVKQTLQMAGALRKRVEKFNRGDNDA